MEASLTINKGEKESYLVVKIKTDKQDYTKVGSAKVSETIKVLCGLIAAHDNPNTMYMPHEGMTHVEE